MSVENVRLFYSKFMKDEEKKEQIKRELEAIKKELEAKGDSLNENSQNEFLVKVYDLLKPIADTEGYSFSLEDLKEFQDNLTNRNEDGKLSDEELDLVAGGVTGFCI